MSFAGIIPDLFVGETVVPFGRFSFGMFIVLVAWYSDRVGVGFFMGLLLGFACSKYWVPE